ncbi:MAG TPA: hypothetical protein VF039_07740 [Longimicrobiales bacterium]
MERGRIPALLVAMLFLALAAAGCENKSRRTPGEVEGTWALAEDSAGAVILRVQGNEVDMFVEDTIGDCYFREDYTVVDIEGVDFRITNGPDTTTVELRRDGEVLVVTVFGQEAEYVAVSVDPDALPVCVPAEPVADCALLPTLGIGAEVSDSLDEADPVTYLGTRYQAYALDFAAPAGMKVSMSSSDVDSYLSLHDSTGAFLEANDDASRSTLDAELDLTLEPGCHILMATTASADELGEFELNVAAP